MRPLHQLSQMLDTLPVWGQVLIAIGLVAYSILAIYGRINLKFGEKAFSKIPGDQIRSNVPHIIQYTVIPVFVTIGYLTLLVAKYTG